MISKKQVAASIDRAGQIFEWCWAVLSQSKHGKLAAARGEDLIAFQNRLVEALWILDAQYRAIIQEKVRLIENKEDYVSAWFKARMACLDKYLKAVKSAIGTAKVLGDGYAWIFYRNDFGLIDQHLKCQRQNNLPPGVGGIGERAFVEKLQGFNGHFVLYHGITSFLRMGDVSFYSFTDKRVTSIGEIKTKKVATHEYQITLGCIYGNGFEFPANLKEVSSKKSADPLPQKIQSRLKRQLDEIMIAFKTSRKASAEKSLGIQGLFYFDKLDEAVLDSKRVGFGYRNAGKSLLIGAIRTQRSKYSERLLNSEVKDLNAKLDPVRERVLSIVDQSLQDNCLFVSTIGYGEDDFPVVLTGTVPLFWWPITLENLYDIIFGNVTVLTMHNPAHFWEMLRQRGFSVHVDSRSRLLTARKTEGKRHLRLENMDYFRWLTGNFLMSDENVVKMLEEIINFARKEGSPTPMRIDLAPRMVFGR